MGNEEGHAGAHFKFEMRLDENGLVIVKSEGILDVDASIRRRRQYIEEGMTVEIVNSRPMIIDIRNSEPPQEGWQPCFQKLLAFFTQIGEEPLCRAYVVSAYQMQGISVLFLQAVSEAADMNLGMRSFEDYDEAYAWASEFMAERPSPS
ncbi:MAG: hypothetical protein RH946_08425 [Rhodospirillales bacterium]